MSAGVTLDADVDQTAAMSDDDVKGSSLSSDVMMTSNWLRAVFVVLYCVIFVVGLGGNSLVVYVVSRNAAMRTITNIFIANLAVSDIMMCLLAVPFTPAAIMLRSWPFGDVMCHVVPMTLGVSVHVSTLTSIAIAVDRYCVIVHPFRPRMKTHVCLLVIVAVWLTSLSISLPLAIYQKVTKFPNPSADDGSSLYVCHEKWPQHTARQFFTVTSMILQYVVPVSIITYCYCCVSIALSRRARARANITGRTAGARCHGDREQLEIRRKRRTNRMLVAMVTIFIVCWLPLNLLHMAQECNKAVARWHYFLPTFLITHVIAMSSTIYNPFLYAWMNDNFKKEFQQVLPRCLLMRGDTARRSMNGATTVGGASQYTSVDVTALTQAATTATAAAAKRRQTSVTTTEADVPYQCICLDELAPVLEDPADD